MEMSALLKNTVERFNVGIIFNYKVSKRTYVNIIH